MANILVSYFKIQEKTTNTMLSYFEGFVDELKAQGNNVLVINTSYYTTWDSNRISSKKVNDSVLEKCKEFSPDIIITFNHRIPKCILDYFRDITTIIWDGDHLRYFCDLQYIRDNIKRYIMVTIVKEWVDLYQEFGFDRGQILFLPNATSIYSKKETKIYPISFLGLNHSFPKGLNSFLDQDRNRSAANKMVIEHLTSYRFDIENMFYENFGSSLDNFNLSVDDIYSLFYFRALILANLLDLGLVISGMQWKNVISVLPELYTAYKARICWNLDEVSNFYNSSIISISTSHPQGRGIGFGWRNYDVMASSACLVTQYSSELRMMTKDYVDIPMYKNPFEARNICNTLLKDEKGIAEIVARSNSFIDKYCRWNNRFKELEDKIKIRITNLGMKGKASLLIPAGNRFSCKYNILTTNTDVDLKTTSKVYSLNRQLKFKDKIRYKIWKHLNKRLKKKGII